MYDINLIKELEQWIDDRRRDIDDIKSVGDQHAIARASGEASILEELQSKLNDMHEEVKNFEEDVESGQLRLSHASKCAEHDDEYAELMADDFVERLAEQIISKVNEE